MTEPMTKVMAVALGFFVICTASYLFSLSPIRAPMAGENSHAELFRLREDIRRIYAVLRLMNGLFGAILATLIFDLLH